MDDKQDLELRDESIYPDESLLRAVLDSSFPAFQQLLSSFEKLDLSHEWRFYKDGKAWLCKVQKKKKTILWMSAWKGYFKATAYFPLRLLDTVLALELSEATKKNIEDTPNVGKSKPCTFEVHSPEILSELEKVMVLKIHSK